MLRCSTEPVSCFSYLYTEDFFFQCSRVHEIALLLVAVIQWCKPTKKRTTSTLSNSLNMRYRRRISYVTLNTSHCSRTHRQLANDDIMGRPITCTYVLQQIRFQAGRFKPGFCQFWERSRRFLNRYFHFSFVFFIYFPVFLFLFFKK